MNSFELEDAMERAKRIGNRTFPKFHGDVEEWLCSLRDWLLDPAAVRVVEHVYEELLRVYDADSLQIYTFGNRLDQTECELEDIREKYNALLQQHEELCGNAAAKGVAAAVTADGVVSNSTERTDCNV